MIMPPLTLDLAFREYLGVPFRHQGRDAVIGFDCIGGLVLAATDCGMPQVEFDCTDYDKNPAHGVLERHMSALFGPMLPTSQMQAGDIAAVDYLGAIRHVGVVGLHPDGGFTLIHTNSKIGRVTEARIDAKWQRRIKGVWRP